MTLSVGQLFADGTSENCGNMSKSLTFSGHERPIAGSRFYSALVTQSTMKQWC